MKRRLFSILLVLCMALAMLPTAAFAKPVSFNGEIIIEIIVGNSRMMKQSAIISPVKTVNSVLTDRIPVPSSR